MPPRDRPPPRTAGASRFGLERHVPRVDVPRPEPSLTPMGVKAVSLSALVVRVEQCEERGDDLETRVRNLESRRDSVVTISDYPRIAKQHADTSEMEKLVNRRETRRTFVRAVLQAVLIAALLGAGGLVWSWWTGPKPQNPPVRHEP